MGYNAAKSLQHILGLVALWLIFQAPSVKTVVAFVVLWLGFSALVALTYNANKNKLIEYMFSLLGPFIYPIFWMGMTILNVLILMHDTLIGTIVFFTWILGYCLDTKRIREFFRQLNF